MKRLSQLTETVLSNTITMHRIFLSFKDSHKKPLRRRPPAFFSLSAAQPAHRWRSSNNGDLNKIYDTATPNPTGSLSGLWFDMTEDERDVTGIAGKVTHLVCRIKNLGNHTVSDVKTHFGV